jgi:phage/plasmid-associated DNA primase
VYAETPALGFLDEMCERGANYEVPKAQLYECYKQWCETVGGRPAHMNVFGAVCKQQGIGKSQLRRDGRVMRFYTTVRIAQVTTLKVVNDE